MGAKAKRKPTARTNGNTGKRGKPENLIPWKPGQSGNPSGKPKGGGTTVTYYLKQFAGMTPQAVADECDTYAKKLREHPDKLPMAGIVAVRALIALIDEPDARLFGHVLDRIDGVVKVSPPTGNTFNALVINAKPDDGAISGIFAILARTGALESGISLAPADGVYPAQADDETSGVPVIAAP